MRVAITCVVHGLIPMITGQRGHGLGTTAVSAVALEFSFERSIPT